MCLENYGVRNKFIVRGLIERLGDAHEDVRKKAMNALMFFGISSKDDLRAAMIEVGLIKIEQETSKSDTLEEMIRRKEEERRRKAQETAQFVKQWLAEINAPKKGPLELSPKRPVSAHGYMDQHRSRRKKRVKASGAGHPPGSNAAGGSSPNRAHSRSPTRNRSPEAGALSDGDVLNSPPKSPPRHPTVRPGLIPDIPQKKSKSRAATRAARTRADSRIPEAALPAAEDQVAEIQPAIQESAPIGNNDEISVQEFDGPHSTTRHGPDSTAEPQTQTADGDPALLQDSTGVGTLADGQISSSSAANEPGIAGDGSVPAAEEGIPLEQASFNDASGQIVTASVDAAGSSHSQRGSAGTNPRASSASAQSAHSASSEKPKSSARADGGRRSAASRRTSAASRPLSTSSRPKSSGAAFRPESGTSKAHIAVDAPNDADELDHAPSVENAAGASADVVAGSVYLVSRPDTAPRETDTPRSDGDLPAVDVTDAPGDVDQSGSMPLAASSEVAAEEPQNPEE
jgi:hypothetical protein